MLTANGFLCANGMEMPWLDGRWIKSWFGAWVSCGSQVSSKSRAFLMSAIGSAILLHSADPFASPKASLSNRRTYNVPFQFI